MKSKSDSSAKKAETTTKAKPTTRAVKPAKSASASSNITFEYFAPEAKEVRLAGSFNNWNAQAIELKREKSGRWKIEMSLEPGRYEYRYLVDGNWQNDQRPVTCVRNEYGSSNCVIEVGQTDH